MKKIRPLTWKKIEVIIYIILLIALPILFISKSIIILLIMWGMLIITEICTYVFWRCPHCGRRLPRRLSFFEMFNLMFCPYCSMFIDDINKDNK